MPASPSRAPSRAPAREALVSVSSPASTRKINASSSDGRCMAHQNALIFLVEAGGDTDTNASLAGALLGARDGEAGIPPRWLDQLGTAKGVSQLAERLVRREG